MNLLKTHAYYYQMQLQMFVCDVKSCDLNKCYFPACIFYVLLIVMTHSYMFNTPRAIQARGVFQT